MSRTRRTLAFDLLAVLTLPTLMAGCQQGTVSQSRLSTTVQGREIVAIIDGPAFISGTEGGDGAVVSFAGKKVVVERGRVLIDGAAKASIPADAKKVELDSSKGVITVHADGKQVYKSEK
jgi:hypothetical protein